MALISWEDSTRLAGERLSAAFSAAKVRGGMFRCCCCQRHLLVDRVAWIGGFIPKDPKILERMKAGKNVAAYVLCDECNVLPEDEMTAKVQEYLIENGLFRTDLKPLDAPGGHSPGHHKPESKNQIFPKKE